MKKITITSLIALLSIISSYSQKYVVSYHCYGETVTVTENPPNGGWWWWSNNGVLVTSSNTPYQNSYTFTITKNSRLVFQNSTGSNPVYQMYVITAPLQNLGVITGLNTVCKGQNSITYSVSSDPNESTSYAWTLPTGATGSSKTNSISVNYGANAVSGNITVRASNACGVSNLSTLPITVNSLPNTPSAISGTNNVCPGQNGLTYTVPLITGATSYVWTLPTGATGTSATNSITVNYSSAAIASNISVQGKNSCGLGSISSFPIQVLCSPNISYTSQNTYTTGSPITPLAPTNTGGPVSGNYTITSNLPYGLIFDPVTGTISGIPTIATFATNYTVTTKNNAGSNTSTFSISITDLLPPSISYNSPQSYTVGTTISPLVPNNTGGIIPSTSSPLVTTYAGNFNGIPNLDARRDIAKFGWIHDLILDSSNNIYIAEFSNHRIRKISTSGIVTTFAGSGSPGSDDGIGIEASFRLPKGLAFDKLGNLYITDNGNSKIRKITPSGVVSTFAGNGTKGSLDGIGSIANFNGITGLTIDAIGNLYVADSPLIRKITPEGVVSTFAGNGTTGSVDGIGSAANFEGILGVTIDAIGNLYLAQWVNNKIRKITPAGVVSTFAGNGSAGATDGIGSVASFIAPTFVKIDAFGNLYVGDNGNRKIRKITPSGIVSTFAGSGSAGHLDGYGLSASFTDIEGIAFDSSGNLYVNDSPLIRKISITGYTITPNLPTGLTFDSTTGIISGTPTIASPATTYTVTGNNYSGSSKTTIVISTGVLGINDFSLNNIKLFPNPSHSILNLSVTDGTHLDKVTIVDITGKVVVKQTKNLSTINVEQLAKGVYILTAYAGDKKYQEKFIKE